MKIVHGGTPPGLARPGSRVSERISCGVPISPSTTRRWAAAKSRGEPPVEADLERHAGGLGRRDRRGRSRSSVIAIGFSQKTALPAAAAATISSAWAVDDAVMTTASTLGVGDQLVRVGRPRGSRGGRRVPRRPRARVGDGDQVAPGPGGPGGSACDVPIRPAPMSPTRTGSTGRGLASNMAFLDRAGARAL